MLSLRDQFIKLFYIYQNQQIITKNGRTTPNF
jgi:hypothetical protein